MNTRNIDSFISHLSVEEKSYLLSKLKSTVLSLDKTVISCPCCNETNFKKNGFYKNVLQKYKCLNTSKVFSYKTNTILSHIQDLSKLEQLMELMVEKNFPTLKVIQETLKISAQTAFDWRTKIITALYKEINLDNNIIEFDETNFRLSRKGRQGMSFSRKRGEKLVGDNKYNVKVFMSYSRTTKKLELFTSHIGRTAFKDVENYLGVKKGLVVYSDKHQAYKKYFNKSNVKHAVFKSENHVSLTDRNIHNQTINYFCGSLANFLDIDLKGVSTKYIQGYLNWFMFIQNNKNENNLKDSILTNKVALDIFKQKEKEFQYFLKINGRNNYGYFNDKYF
ncbi:MAG: IS1595 family transposase [Cytophagales bacterium]